MLHVKNFKSNSIVKDSHSKVVVISHNDLDGAGPIIIAKNFYNACKFFTVSNNSVDKIVTKVIYNEEYQDVDLILITDVSIVDKDLAESINTLVTNGDKNIFLFDHHGTATWLNKYDWAVVTQCEGVSATLLYFSYMEELLDVNKVNFLKKLSATISDWDTWRWIKAGNILAKDLSTLYAKTGINYFIESYKNIATNSIDLIDLKDSALLKDIYTKEKYVIVPSAKRTMEDIDIRFTFCYDKEVIIDNVTTIEPISVDVTKKVRCVCISDAPSDLAEQLYEDGIDYVFMFYSNGVTSCRSRVEDINLGEWCKAISSGKGGGHSKSAGFTLDRHTFWIYNKYLEKHYNLE